MKKKKNQKKSLCLLLNWVTINKIHQIYNNFFLISDYLFFLSDFGELVPKM